MVRTTILVFAIILCSAFDSIARAAEPRFTPGAAGVGDPYFPLAGNGGYDVQHYLLALTYTPSTDRLAGIATITARATQDLSQFNLDFMGLSIRSILVNAAAARWDRDGGELIVHPRRGVPNGATFLIIVAYDGIPKPVANPQVPVAGFIHTDDGAVVSGQPRSAATWFPANDHPIDKAAYTITLTVPAGLTAVSNGELLGKRTLGPWTTWVWNAREPMASYLVTAAIGTFDLRHYRANGIQYWDALDPDLFDPVVAPHTGTQFALSHVSDLTYKRLVRTIQVPSDGATVSFWVTRDTEPDWDFVIVEAHTVGQDDWTTLPDANGHTSQDTGFSCPFWLNVHPFLTHYQTAVDETTCAPSGTSGDWWAASGTSDGWEQWSVNLAAWAGTNVEIAITYASDDATQLNGIFVDDIVVSSGAGTTSFEADGNELDGWTVPGAPTGSTANPNDWIVGTVDDGPPIVGKNVVRAFAQQPEIIAFLSSVFGRYPFSATGGIVDDNDVQTSALETQTRPIYAKSFFITYPQSDERNDVVHELAHQWVGDSVTLARWQDIWLNEGLATYAEGLWNDFKGLGGTIPEDFDFFYNGIPADDPFWSVKIGDPGPDALFVGPVYLRGAMTLHQLRVTVGDADFFTILRQWTQSKAGQNVTTAQFIQLAEQVSGEELSPLFDAWLYTSAKPVLSAAGQAQARTAATDPRYASPAARALLKQVRQERAR